VQGLSIAARVPQAEVAVADGAVALVLRVLDAPTPDDRERLAEFERGHGVRIFLQPAGPDSITALTPGAPALHYALPEFAVDIEFQPTDFIQVNGALNGAMVGRALEVLEPAPTDTVLDLFCGLGNFSLPLARRSAQVVAVEGDAGLVGRARDNALRNGIDNAAFHVTDLFKDVADLPWARRLYDRVLLDPPRAGAREVLPVIRRSGARRVLYISCHPGSLARDAGLLVKEHGYRLSAAGVMDMFPHTAHVEAMAVFDR
jgi:23S rRNA (uracil1939-C5)-methyltransferase